MRRFFARLRVRLLVLLSSRGFLVFIVALLVFEALWVALSFKYPMLWDEYYHFGLIRFYAHHLNPFIAHQPTSLDIYGNVARSPKYLYHYLMSFPFRFISLFTANQTTQIIFLRLINICFFAGGLVAFSAALRQITKSRALVNFVLLMIVLLPLSPLLAAQINYDNLQFLLTGLVFYWAFKFMRAKNFESVWLLLIAGVGLLSSVVKYTFLPLLAAITLYFIFFIWKKYGNQSLNFFWQSTKGISRPKLVVLLLLIVLGLFLCVERFGVNMVRYHSPDPSCAKVLSVERCLNFSPFKHQYMYQQARAATPGGYVKGPLLFTVTDWFAQLYGQYFTSGTQIAYEQFEVDNALKVPFITMLVFGAIGMVCFLLSAPQLLRRHDIRLILLSMFLLAVALWLTDYTTYRRTGFPLAIQGRYLLPIIPFGLLLGALGVSQAIASRKVKAVLATLAIAGLVWGGGLVTHIVLSKQYWYWPNQTVNNVNQTAQRTLKPLFW